MKKSLLLLSAVPLIIGCASDRADRASTAAYDRQPAVESQGYNRTDRDFNQRDVAAETDLDTRRQVRDANDIENTRDNDYELRDSVRDSGDATLGDSQPPDLIHDAPGDFSARGLENWRRTRWSRFQY